MLLLHQTGIKRLSDAFAVKIAADKYQLYHSVAIDWVTVTCEIRILFHKHTAVFFRSGGIPFTGLGKILLHSGLLEEQGHIAVMAEIQHTFATYDILWPQTGAEIIKAAEVERRTAIIYESTYTVFLSFTLAVVMVMMVVAVCVTHMTLLTMLMMFMVMMMLVLVMMVMVMLMIVVMMVFVTLFRMFTVSFRLLFGRHGTFYLLYPCGGSYGTLKVEEMCIKQPVKVYVTVIALNNFGLRLQSTYYGTYSAGFFTCNLRNLIEQNDITELYLLDYEIFDVFFINILTCQIVTAAEISLQSQCVNHSNDTVKTWAVRTRRPGRHSLHSAYSLCYRFRLAYT